MAESAVAEPPIVPTQSGADFIKEAMASAFGPQAVQSAGKPQVVTAPTGEPAPKSALETKVEAEKAAKSPEETPKEPTDPNSEPTDEAAPADEKGKYRWGELKKEVKTQKERLAAYEKAEAEWKASQEEFTRSKEELSRLQKQIEDANRELYTVKIEATPEWKQTVQEPLANILKQIETVAQLNGIEPTKLYDAVDKASKGDRASFKEATEGMEELDRNDLYQLSKQLINVDARMAELRKNSKDAYETSMRSQHEQQTKYQQEMQESYQKAADAVSERFVSTVKEFLPEDSGISFDAIKTESQTIDSWSPELKVYAGYTAAAFPEIMNFAKSQAAELKAAKQELAKLRGGGAKANTAGTPPSSPKEVRQPQSASELSKKTYEQYAAEANERFSHLGR